MSERRRLAKALVGGLALLYVALAVAVVLGGRQVIADRDLRLYLLFGGAALALGLAAASWQTLTTRPAETPRGELRVAAAAGVQLGMSGFLAAWAAEDQLAGLLAAFPLLPVAPLEVTLWCTFVAVATVIAFLVRLRLRERDREPE